MAEHALAAALISAAATAVVAPVVGVFIGRTDNDGATSRQVDAQLKRLDLLVKLQQFRQTNSLKGNVNWDEGITAGLRSILNSLSPPPKSKKEWRQISSYSWFRRWFLIYPAPATGGMLARFCLYVTIFYFVAGVIYLTVTAYIGRHDEDVWTFFVPILAIYCVIYLSVAFLFRWLAARSDARFAPRPGEGTGDNSAGRKAE